MTHTIIDVAELGSDRKEFECIFPAGTLDLRRGEVEQVGDVTWRGCLVRPNERVRLSGRLEGMLEAPCDRCLEPSRIAVAHDFELFFEQRDSLEFEENAEIELEEPDTRTSFMTGTSLDMDEVVVEQLLLALPMKPLCRDDCAGLCAGCGINLNLGSCDCTTPRAGNAFSALGELKARLEKQNS